MVNELNDEGIAGGGRQRDPINTVQLSPLDGVAIGVELGYRSTVLVARKAHQPHGAIKSRTVEVGAVRGEQVWLDPVVEAIRDLVREVGEIPDDIATVGMGIPRMINPRDQALTRPLLPPWQRARNPAVALTERLAHLRGRGARNVLRVRLDNDANLGAYAESLYTYPTRETLVYIKASTGVGAGIVIGGRLLRGAGGCSGELGHTMVQPNGRFCLCGGRGCLETLVGADVMLRDARTGLSDQLFNPPTNIDQFLTRVEQEDPICTRILQEAARYLGYSIGNLCNLLNPNVVLLGGAFGMAGGIALEACRLGIDRTAMAAARADLHLAASTLPYATAQGALLMGIEGEGPVLGLHFSRDTPQIEMPACHGRRCSFNLTAEANRRTRGGLLSWCSMPPRLSGLWENSAMSTLSAEHPRGDSLHDLNEESLQFTYIPPKVADFGQVRDLTKGSSGSGSADANSQYYWS
ncbi:ROK family protein [Nonomuraea sp. LPB2021202275-12-8]|uniref:ROK family protein n=1 Tax=Nonomuraea sp. LPB2021202275-12-8 TaxID=3120159 RepID=UPI00300D1463